MGLFSKPEKRKRPQTGISSGSVRCARCRKTIRSGRKYILIEGKHYCMNCGESEMDWNFLELMDILDEL